jgi:hypothetical protein
MNAYTEINTLLFMGLTCFGCSAIDYYLGTNQEKEYIIMMSAGFILLAAWIVFFYYEWRDD